MVSEIGLKWVNSVNMVRGIINVYLIVGRTVAGLAVGLLLAFVGDVAARVINLLLGFPWPFLVHQNIQVIGIGLGAGIAAYLAWANFSLRWYWIVGSLLLVLGGSTVGAYLGDIYGPGPDPTYWWSRYASDKTVYLTAAIGGLAISTTLGLVRELLAQRRVKLRDLSIHEP